MRIQLYLFCIYVLLASPAVNAYTSTDIANEALCRYENDADGLGGQCKVFVQNIFNTVAAPVQLGSGYCSAYLAVGTEVSLENARPGDLIQTNRTEPFDMCNPDDETIHVGLMHSAVLYEKNGTTLTVIDSNWCQNDCELINKRTWNISEYLSIGGYDSDGGDGDIPPLFIHFYHVGNEEISYPDDGLTVKPSSDNPYTCKLESGSCGEAIINPCNYLTDFFYAGDAVRTSVTIDEVNTPIKVRVEAYREDDSSGTTHPMMLDWNWTTENWLIPVDSKVTHSFYFENLRLHNGLKKENTTEEWTQWKFKVYVLEQGDADFGSLPKTIVNYRVKRSPANPGYTVNSPSIHYTNPTVCNEEPTPDERWFYRCEGHETTQFDKNDVVYLSARVDAVQVEHRVKFDTYINGQHKADLSGFTTIVHPAEETPGFDFWDHAFHRFSFMADQGGNYQVYMLVDRKVGGTWIHENTTVSASNAELIAEFSVSDDLGMGGCLPPDCCVLDYDCLDFGLVCINDSCQSSCIPSCASKQCGPDGCTGSCGSCPAGQTCNTSTWDCEDVPPNAECAGGECCDTSAYQFKGKGVPCGDQITDYLCEGSCEGVLRQEVRQRYCTGTGSTCTSTLEQVVNQSPVHTCGCDQVCTASQNGCYYTSSCGSGYPEGHPDGTLIKTATNVDVFVVEGGKKRKINDYSTIDLSDYFQIGWHVVVSQEEMNSYPKGSEYTIGDYTNISVHLFQCPASPAGSCVSGWYYLYYRGFGYNQTIEIVHPNALQAIKTSWHIELESGDYSGYANVKNTYAPLHPGTLVKWQGDYYWAGYDRQVRKFNMSWAQIEQVGYESYDVVDMPSGAPLAAMSDWGPPLTPESFGEYCEPSFPPNWYVGAGGGGGVAGINEGEECYTGLPETRGVGMCQDGTVVYSDSGDFWCAGQVLPTAEHCTNNLDDDCDGKTDSADCPGPSVIDADGDGYDEDEDCDDQNASIHPGAQELCDNVDNDCDYAVDEGFGLGLSCDGSDSDFCVYGVVKCSSSGFGTVCQETVHYSEQCNGIDDDCDGETDEGFAQLCCGQGQCHVCIDSCQSGQLHACVPAQAAFELCNGLDDDCDGVTDEGFSLGEPCDGADTDLCAGGIVACDNGAAVCKYDDVGGNIEVCNGLDDDCDGQIDGPELDETDCDDGIDCTVDFCDVGGCAHVPDDDACGTTAESCKVFLCSEEIGCVLNSAAQGTPCDDGNKCTVGDACADGSCTGAPVVCNDADPCTTDSCNPDTGCVFTPGECCTPNCLGKICGAPDGCGGVCNTGDASCDDGDPCTTDTCVPDYGCAYQPNPDGCDDGNLCTEDTCDTSAPSGCRHKVTKTLCYDANPCTLDICTVYGCEYKDKSGCVASDACISGYVLLETGNCACDTVDECKKAAAP